MDLLNEDGQSVLPNQVDGKFGVGRAPGVRPGNDILNVLVLHIDSLQLPREGMYTFPMRIEGDLAGGSQFRARRAAQAALTG